MQKKFKNRYGNEYWFEQLSEDTYAIRGDLKYWRFGGKEGQEEVNELDLGFVDPSGGPFISQGYKIEDRIVNQISAQGQEIIFKVE
jgi:hypothetical protein